TAEAPEITADASLAAPRIAGRAYEGLSAAVRYGAGAASLDAAFRQDSAHALTVAGRVPTAISWDGGLRAEPGGDVDLRVRSNGLSLAFANAFGGKSFRDAGGELHADVAVTGPLSHPEARGPVSLRDGTVFLIPLNVSVTEGTLEAMLDPRSVVLNRLWLRSGEGKIWGEGKVTLAEGEARGLDLLVQADDWPAIRTSRYDAALDGWLSATGALAAPKVYGRIEVTHGVLRPDLAFLTKNPPPPDPTIQVVRSDAPPPPPEEPREPAKPERPPPDVFRNALLGVTVVIDRDTWVKHDNATVELEGGVWVDKAPGVTQPSISGAIRTVRGWATFQKKRFVISQGQIVFTGGTEIVPTLDIVAQYRRSGYLIEAVVGGSAQKPSLDLRSDPNLEQADILSVLLFGKTAEELNEGQQSALGDQAQQVAASYAATALAQSAARELGVEEMGIQIEELTTERVAVGKYLTERTYVRVGQEVGGDQGQEVALEYEIFRNWEFVASTTSTGNNGADVIWHKRY
ncbi:MAG: translocation/assembly module TamB domain-containing protein, partial [Candidatus Binatia bacterium]